MSPFFLTAVPSTSAATTTLKPPKRKYSPKYCPYSVRLLHLCFVCLREKPKNRRIRSIEEKFKNAIFMERAKCEEDHRQPDPPHLPHYIVVLLFPLISLLLCSLSMIAKAVKIVSKRRCSQCIFRKIPLRSLRLQVGLFSYRIIVTSSGWIMIFFDTFSVRYPSVSICICHPSSAKEYGLFTGTNPRYLSTYITVGWWWGIGNNEEAIGTEWD